MKTMMPILVRVGNLGLFLLLILEAANPAHAHASEQGFVLLLPTDIYIMAGAATVIFTLLLLVFLPKSLTAKLFQTCTLWSRKPLRMQHLTSFLSTLLLGWLVWSGLTGTRDPLENPLPLTIWTVWWICLVFVQGFIGNHWRYTNPWTGSALLLAKLTGLRSPFRYPRKLGHWPGVVLFLSFSAILMVDPAPADPARLARYVGIYWYLMLLGLVLFGPVWLVRAESITIMMRAYHQMAISGHANTKQALGLSGWQVLRHIPPKPALAVFMLLLLGCGSFDGLNETFWWMGQLGINPLEFPGRSAVIMPNLIGMLLANVLLLLFFTSCLFFGLKISGETESVLQSFCRYAPTLLPIALAYHLAHYLPSLLVEGQYVVKYLCNLLGLDDFYVTTGFFNRPATVKAIWLTQAGAVVIGHVIAILLAHVIALRVHGSIRQAMAMQIPLALFMICYTIFGLWLLASPRGL